MRFVATPDSVIPNAMFGDKPPTTPIMDPMIVMAQHMKPRSFLFPLYRLKQAQSPGLEVLKEITIEVTKKEGYKGRCFLERGCFTKRKKHILPAWSYVGFSMQCTSIKSLAKLGR